jgi:hypothetical protein
MGDTAGLCVTTRVNAIDPAGCNTTRAQHAMGISVFVDRKGFSSASPELPCPPPCRRMTTEEKRAGSHQKWAQTMSIVVRALGKFFVYIFFFFFFFFCFQLTNSFHIIGYKHAATTALETTRPRPAAMNDNHHMTMKTGCGPYNNKEQLSTRSQPCELLLQGGWRVYRTHNNIHGHQHPGSA